MKLILFINITESNLILLIVNFFLYKILLSGRLQHKYIQDCLDVGVVEGIGENHREVWLLEIRLGKWESGGLFENIGATGWVSLRI